MAATAAAAVGSRAWRMLSLRRLFAAEAALASSPDAARPLSAYIVPSEDAHQSEYIAECDARRAYISGFTGSAGLAIIAHDQAALFTDGRYHLQAAKELDDQWTLVKSGMPDAPTPEQWLIKTLPGGSRIGVDPRLISAPRFRLWADKLGKANLELVPVADNLVDMVWQKEGTRPARPSGTITALPLRFAGKTVTDKLAEMRKEYAKAKCSCLVLTALDEIAWLFNLRGSDVAFNPVFFSYALVADDETVLFVDQDRLGDEVAAHLHEAAVSIRPYEAFFEDFAARVPTLSANGSIWLGKNCSQAVADLVPRSAQHEEVTPACHAKAVKNDVELEGMRQAHIRDGAALCQLFAWLEDELVSKGVTTISEVDAADKAEELRSRQQDYVSLSFATISSVGANAAVIHYNPKANKTPALLNTSEIYLIDSGGQYRDGTTDVTRTMHFGTPSAHERECCTRVLQGAISLDRAIFPNGTVGQSLDSFARQALWRSGLDYRHGTGHGVGMYLNVHEGPIGINNRMVVQTHPLKAGMVVTDEPGYYEAGSFGVRIENVVEVIDVATKHNFGAVGFLGFRSMTVVPIQAKLMELSLMTEEEITWVDAYHERCLATVGPLLEAQGSPAALDWLRRNTRPLREQAAGQAMMDTGPSS